MSATRPWTSGSRGARWGGAGQHRRPHIRLFVNGEQAFDVGRTLRPNDPVAAGGEVRTLAVGEGAQPQRRFSSMVLRSSFSCSRSSPVGSAAAKSSVS